MLGVNKREVVKRRYEFSVKSPCVGADLAGALFLAEKRLEALEGERAVGYDDALTVEARDDEIVVWFEREEN